MSASGKAAPGQAARSGQRARLGCNEHSGRRAGEARRLTGGRHGRRLDARAQRCWRRAWGPVLCAAHVVQEPGTRGDAREPLVRASAAREGACQAPRSRCVGDGRRASGDVGQRAWAVVEVAAALTLPGCTQARHPTPPRTVSRRAACARERLQRTAHRHHHPPRSLTARPVVLIYPQCQQSPPRRLAQSSPVPPRCQPQRLPPALPPASSGRDAALAQDSGVHILLLLEPAARSPFLPSCSVIMPGPPPNADAVCPLLCDGD